MTKDHLQGLNPAQREAVCHLDGPLLVLAGAGSGKTRGITHRIAHLVVERVVRADQILGVTFTNKAAGEMKERVVSLLGPVGRFTWLSTFHSFCARLLRSHIEMLGYKRSFTIYDEADSKALIKRIIKDLGIPENQPSPAGAKSAISRSKDKLLSAEDYMKSANDFISQNVARIYEQYQSQLKKNNALDFDDLIFSAIILLDKFPELLALYQNKFPYLLVDEYQDTNYAQYRLVKLLAGEKKNICVVGDDDQAIYGWRGADIRNILDFESDFPGCKVVKLEQNYRSTRIILDAAWEVIRKNINRKPKKLFTNISAGNRVTLMMCGDDRDESEAITGKIQLDISDDKCLSDFAVLYRTHSQSRVLEDALRDKGIPYVIIGGTRFYERKEVKDVIAYLRLLVNPADTESLLRIINVPRRKVGKTSVEKLLKAAQKENVSAYELLDKPEITGLKGKTGNELKKLYEILNDLSAKLDKLAPDDITKRLIDKIGYLKMLENEASPEADVRADNVKELVNAVEAYMFRIEEEEAEEDIEPSLAGFLEEVALLSEVNNQSDNDDAVMMMSLHAAKGLEFETVFLTGMEQGLFPLIRNSIIKDEIEEERRLCYVGITRAKSKLYLSLAGFRRRYDGPNFAMPSCFLDDIPEKLIEIERFNHYGYNDRWSVQKNTNSHHNNKHRRKKHISHHDNDHYDKEDDAVDDVLKVGMVVSHAKFGVGKVINREGSGEDMILEIRFKTGAKKIMIKYAALEILGA